MNPIFRDAALQYLNSGDELDNENDIGPITLPSLALICVASLLIIAAFWWGIYGKIFIEIEGTGVVVSSMKIRETNQLLMRQKQAQIKTIQMLKNLYLQKECLFRQHYLTLEELEKARESFWREYEAEFGEQNGIFIQSPIIGCSRDPCALIFLSDKAAKKIKVGMRASMSSGPEYNNPILSGKVESITPTPVSKSLIFSYLGNAEWVDMFFQNGPPTVVTISLRANKINLFYPGAQVFSKITVLSSSLVQLLMEK